MASENYPTYADLANKVAVVTGGSRGIGAVTCRLLAENGAKVTVGGRDEAAINSVRPARRPRQLPGPILRAHRAGEAPDAGGNPATGGGDAPAGADGEARGRGAGHAVSGIGELVLDHGRHAGCGRRSDHGLRALGRGSASVNPGERRTNQRNTIVLRSLLHPCVVVSGSALGEVASGRLGQGQCR
jgi:hypothetical protein